MLFWDEIEKQLLFSENNKTAIAWGNEKINGVWREIKNGYRLETFKRLELFDEKTTAVGT